MKKKIVKIIVLLIIIFLVLLFVNRLYTTNIMYKTYKTMLEKAKEDNFYSKTTLISNNNGIPNGSNVCIVETYIKGGTYVKNISSIGNSKALMNLKFWENINTSDEKGKYYIVVTSSENENPIVSEYEIEKQKEPVNRIYKYNFASSLVIGDGKLSYYEFDEDYTFKQIFMYALKNSFGDFRVNVKLFSEQKGYYKLHLDGQDIYINKDTYFQEFSISQFGYTKYEYYIKDVTDEDLIEPTIQENN